MNEGRNKEYLKDARLSWKAKGILAFLLSKPGLECNWMTEDLVKQSKDGKEAVYSGINELIKFGYLVRIKSRDKGRFMQVEYHLSSSPEGDVFYGESKE